MNHHATSSIGLTVTGSQVRAAQLRREGGRWKVARVLSLPRLSPGDEFDATEACRIAGVLERQGWAGREVVLALPNELLIRGLIEVKAGVDDDAFLLAAQEVERTEGLLAGEYELAAWHPVEGATAGKVSLVCVTGARHDAVETISDAFATSGYHLKAVDSRAMALSRCVEAKGPGLTAVLDITMSNTELVLFDGRGVVYQRGLLELGLQHVRLGLVEAGLDGPAADHFIHAVGLGSEALCQPTDASLTQVMHTYTQALLDEAEPALSYVARMLPSKPVKRLLVVGDGAEVPGLAEAVAKRLGLDLMAQQGAALDIASGEAGLQAAFAVPMGAAMHPGRGALNLLPAEVLRARRNTVKSRQARVAVGLYTALLLAGTMGYLGLAGPQSASASASSDDLAVATQRNETMQHEIVAAEAQLEEVRRRLAGGRVLSERPDWSQMLRLIAVCGGEAIKLDGVTLQMAAPKIDAGAWVELSGFAGDPWAVSNFVLRLEEQGLFDKVKILNSQRQPFGNGQRTAFRLRCELWGAGGGDTP